MSNIILGFGFKQLYFSNGFGGKRVTLAPGFSKYVISDLCKYASTRDWAVQNCKLHVTGL